MPTTESVRSKIRLANSAGAQQHETLPVEHQSNFTSIESQQIIATTRLNPLAELLDDDTFEILSRHRLIDTKSMRDYHIRKAYREKRRRMSASDAIDQIQQSHPYLQFDTIRKIVYQVSKAS